MPSTANPNVYIIAGPNGAGKTTFAREFLPAYANCRVFINADLIAHGLSPFAPDRAAFRAGRLVLTELEEHAARGEDFGFETTLSGRSNLSVVRKMKARGYRIYLFYIWAPSEDLTLARIRDRVRLGGHDIPPDVVHRRFDRSLRNFFSLYRPLADEWHLFDNSGAAPVEIASLKRGQLLIMDNALYTELVRLYGSI
jgi:predicted ABC-type ATPase